MNDEQFLCFNCDSSATGAVRDVVILYELGNSEISEIIGGTKRHCCEKHSTIRTIYADILAIEESDVDT
jgi:hypothetical protein